ncbi:ABC transporter permease [Pseudomonas abietaniphila]|uniref:ABC transporter permease n=1 Tax=Pseudomonas abietaniphila TaxID=89065 RepID=UPI000780EB79|nr:ABC transporter permease [Pseudomonas abietaniphila]
MTKAEFFKRELATFSDGWHAWYLLALHDVKGRYRRSIIGPFWITLTSLLFVIGLGMVYSRLLNLNLKDYLPFLACGIIAWTFIVTFVNEGASSIINSGHIIKQISMPILTHVMRVAFRNLLIFLHSWVILIPLLMWYGYLTLYGLATSILGIALVMFVLTPVAALLGVICARYRDVLPMIASGMQLLFFVTPVMWHPDQLAGLTAVIKYNPFVYLIDLIREPMLNGYFPFASAGVVFSMGVVLWASALGALFLKRKKIPYWL